MADRLSSFCVACARFTAGDNLGQLLALAAAAPYFATYHVAVLLHARRHAIAACESMPGPTKPSRRLPRTSRYPSLPACRELHMAFVFIGMLLTTGTIPEQMWITSLACFPSHETRQCMQHTGFADDFPPAKRPVSIVPCSSKLSHQAAFAAAAACCHVRSTGQLSQAWWAAWERDRCFAVLLAPTLSFRYSSLKIRKSCSLEQGRTSYLCSPGPRAGMPSSHSAVMAFAATTCLLLYRHRQSGQQQAQQLAQGAHGKAAGGTARQGHSRGGQRGSASGDQLCPPLAARLVRAVQLLEVQLLCLLTAAVAYGRVYLGYHSPAQVAAGLVLGTILAAAWWRLTLVACMSAAARALLRWAPSRALHLRNTLGCADVHAAEAALFECTGQAAVQGQAEHAD